MDEILLEIFLKRDDVISLTLEGEPVFEATSTALAFGFKNPLEAIFQNVEQGGIFTITQDRKQINFLNESGFFDLAFASNIPEAKNFRKWFNALEIPLDVAQECLNKILSEN